MASKRQEEKRPALLQVLEGKVKEPPPIWFMRQAGRYLPEYQALRKKEPDFLRFCLSPDLTVEAALQPIRRFELDAAILFSDILLIPFALGQNLRFEEARGPVLEALESRDIAGLSLRGLARLDPVYETIRVLRSRLPEEAALIGFAGAPWTLASYMVGGGSSRAPALRMARMKPDDFDRLISLLTQAVSACLSEQVLAGAQAIQIFDSWAGDLPPDLFDRLCIAPTAKIVENLKARHPALPVIGFAKGAGEAVADYFHRTGLTAVSVDHTLRTGYVREALMPLGPVQGNLSPDLLASGGTPVHQAAGEIISAWRGRPYIFGLGHGILPHTPPDHVADLVRFVRETARPGR